jgi:hypothetical protein
MFRERQALANRATQGRAPRVRSACFEDYEQVAALQIRNGFGPKSQDEWLALWQENPVYRQFRDQWPIGWVLEAAESDRIVGWLGNIPSAYQFKGRRLCAATPNSWVVDASYRGYGMLIMSRFLLQRNVDLFVCSNVSPASEPISRHRHFGFSRVPVGTWDQSSFWITDHPGLTRIVLKMKSVPWSGALAYPIAAALACRDRWKDGWERDCLSIIAMEECREFDNCFDAFWDELQSQNERVLLAVRTRETLTWHFRGALSQEKVCILKAYRGSRLAAYAIFDRQDSPSIGLRRVRLVDFQAHRGAEDAIFSVLSWMLQKCREDGTHMLEVSGAWLNRPGLPRIVAPFHRTMPSWCFYYKSTDPKVSAQLTDQKAWAPSAFDGDASL